MVMIGGEIGGKIAAFARQAAKLFEDWLLSCLACRQPLMQFVLISRATASQ